MIAIVLLVLYKATLQFRHLSWAIQKDHICYIQQTVLFLKPAGSLSVTRPIVHRLLVHLAWGLTVTFFQQYRELLKTPSTWFYGGGTCSWSPLPWRWGGRRTSPGTAPCGALWPLAGCFPGGGNGDTGTCSSHVDSDSVVRAGVFTSKLHPNPPTYPWSSAGY